jgi:hypothetical protein
VSLSSNEKRFPADQSKVPAALLGAMAAVTAGVSPAPEPGKVIGIGVGSDPLSVATSL